jgi:hypothetical protein
MMSKKELNVPTCDLDVNEPEFKSVVPGTSEIPQSKAARDFMLANKEIENEHKQTMSATRLLYVLLGALVLSIVASILLHVFALPELRALESCVTFLQGAITTIMGFLFGTRFLHKK